MAPVALIFGWMIAQGRVGMLAAAVVFVPLALYVSVRPIRSVALAVLLTLLLPFTLALGTAQASVPRLAAMAALTPIVLERHRLGVLRLGVVDYAVAGIVVAACLSWGLGSHEPHSVRAASNYILPLAFYPAARLYGARYPRLFLWLLLVGGTLASLTIWWEALVSHSPLFVDRTSYSWNSTGVYIFRPAGVFGSPPGASTVLGMTALCGLPLLWRAQSLQRVAVLACLGLSGGALIFTFTRAGMIAFALGLILYAALLGPAAWARWVYGAMIVLLAVTLLVLPRVGALGWYQKGILRHGTFAQREVYWANAWPVVTDSPDHLLLGHGINSLVVGQPELPGDKQPDIAASPTLSRFSPHNQYIRTLVEQGIFGIALLALWLLGTIGRGAAAAWRANAERRNVAAMTAAVATFVVISFVNDTLRHPPSFTVVALITGLVVAWAAASEEEVA